jgi:hypothetical protein
MNLTQEFREFAELLNSNNVRYLIVGGIAVALYGYPRYTGDFDIWVDTSDDNASKLIKAIEEFGFIGILSFTKLRCSYF